MLDNEQLAYIVYEIVASGLGLSVDRNEIVKHIIKVLNENR